MPHTLLESFFGPLDLKPVGATFFFCFVLLFCNIKHKCFSNSSEKHQSDQDGVMHFQVLRKAARAGSGAQSRMTPDFSGSCWEAPTRQAFSSVWARLVLEGRLSIVPKLRSDQWPQSPTHPEFNTQVLSCSLIFPTKGEPCQRFPAAGSRNRFTSCSLTAICVVVHGCFCC